MAEAQLLPAEVIDRVFGRMQLSYGSAWLRMWEGLDIEKVKLDWRLQLGWVPSWRHIAWALENRPADWPPNSLQFAALCRQAPVAPERAIERQEGPPVDPLRVAEIVGRLSNAEPLAPDDWQLQLVERVRAGELRPTYFARQALARLVGRAMLCDANADLFGLGGPGSRA